jgi:CNT family concentrative nucleoside transporter
MGVPMQDMVVAGQFIGEKTVLNEFIGYAHMGDYLNGAPLPGGAPPQDLTERTKIILSYAMCGFANFGSIGILVGGLSSLAPERRRDFAQLGVRALIGGTLASFMTAAIAGMLL